MFWVVTCQFYSKGMGLMKTAGKEDPVELDFTKTLLGYL